MVSYRELSKPIDETLDKNYVHTKPWAIELKHRLDNPTMKQLANMNADGKLVCCHQSGFDMGPVKLTGSLGLDGSAAVGCTYNSDLIEGLSFHGSTATSLELPEGGGSRCQKLDFGMQLKSAPWSGHFSVHPLKQSWGIALIGRHVLRIPRLVATVESQTKLNIKAKSVAAAHAISYGIDLSGNANSKPKISGIGCAYSYPISDHLISTALTLAPHNKDAIGKCVVSVCSQSTDGLSEMAARYAFFPRENRTELSAGGGWILDPVTKLTSFKAKIDHTGAVCTAITHKLNDHASLTIGATVDTTKKVGAEKFSNIGLKLNLMA